MKNKFAVKILFVALLIGAVAACASNAANTTVTNNTNVAIVTNTNSNIVADTNSDTVSESASVSNDAAQKLAPDALVANLYRQHNAKKSPFFQTKNRAPLDKYFTKATADMIWKDAVTTKTGEVGALDFDPLYNAQDTEIKNFAVGKPEIKNNSATVPVTFENFGKKQTINYALVQEGGVWKIQDIKYAESSLIEIFKANSAAADSDKNSSKGEFEGKYQVGDTTCTVKPVKMAFEISWEKGSGTEMFFFQDRANDKYIFASDPERGKANVFSFDDENYNAGKFYRADGKEFSVKRIK